MATIGLDKLFYAKITEDEDGNETYATPTSLAKAMTAELSVELAEATLYADDGAAEIVVLVYKCGQKKLNNLYYQVKEQRRRSTWRKTKNWTYVNTLDTKS